MEYLLITLLEIYFNVLTKTYFLVSENWTKTELVWYARWIWNAFCNWCECIVMVANRNRSVIGSLQSQILPSVDSDVSSYTDYLPFNT